MNALPDVEMHVRGLLSAQSSTEAEMEHLFGALAHEQEMWSPSLVGASACIGEIRKVESALISIRDEIEAVIAEIRIRRGDVAAERLQQLVRGWSSQAVTPVNDSDWIRIIDAEAVECGRKFYAKISLQQLGGSGPPSGRDS